MTNYNNSTKLSRADINKEFKELINEFDYLKDVPNFLKYVNLFHALNVLIQDNMNVPKSGAFLVQEFRIDKLKIVVSYSNYVLQLPENYKAKPVNLDSWTK